MGNRLWQAARAAAVAAGIALLAWLMVAHGRARPVAARAVDSEGAQGAAARPREILTAAPARAVAVPSTSDRCVFADAVKRVEFAPDRVRLSVPAVPPASASHDFTLHTRRIAIGGRSLFDEVAAPRPVPPERRGNDVSYRRPGNVVETYEVDGRRIEQSFVLGSRPASGGDLVIDVAVEGSLTARPHAAPPIRPFDIEQMLAHRGAVDYVDAAGRVVVSIGKAWVVDANRATAPVEVLLAGGGYRLRVDGAWLAGAAYPVVVDPPILVDSGAGDAATGGAPTGHGANALAYSTTDNKYMLVIQYQNTDWDIEWAPVNADGTLGGQIRGMGGSETAQTADVWPDIAYSETSNNFLLVWARERDAADGLLTRIMGLRLDTGGFPVGSATPFVIRDTETDTPAIPNDDVGSLANGPVQGPKVAWNNVNDRYLVAWRDGEVGGDVAGVNNPPNRTHGTMARFVEAGTGNFVGAATGLLTMGPTGNVTSIDVAWNPSVSWYVNNVRQTGLYMMALTRTLGTGNPPANWSEDVLLNAVSADGIADGTATGFGNPLNSANVTNLAANASAFAALISTPPDPRIAIVADANPLHPVWLAVWSDQRAGSAGGSQLRGIVATFATNPASPPPDNTGARVLLPDFVFADSARGDVHPAAAWDASRDDFFVAWESLTLDPVTPANNVSDVVGLRMDFGGDLLSDIFTLSAPTAQHLMAIRPAVAYNSSNNVNEPNRGKFLVTFIAGNDNLLFGADDDTHGLLAAPPNAPTLLTHSNNTTTSISWTWTDNSTDETSFRIKDGPNTMATALAGATALTETVPAVNGVTENTRYVRTVVAVNAFGESPPSNVHAAFTSVRTPTAADFAVTQPALPTCRTQATITVVAPPNACAPYPAVAHIPALGRPKGVANNGVLGNGGRVYMGLADVPWVYVIDASTGQANSDQIVARYDTLVPGDPGPLQYFANGVAFDTDANGVNKVFLVSRVDGLQVLNADTGALIQGGLCAGTQPFGVAASQGNDRLYIAGFESNSIHTYNTTSLANVGNECSVSIAGSAAAQACPPAGCPAPGTNQQGDRPTLATASATRGFMAYQGGAANGGVGSIDATGNVSGWVDTGSAGFGIAVHAARNRLYVGHRITNFVSVLDTSFDPPTLMAANQINLPAQAVSESYALAVDEPSNRLFVIGSGNNLFAYNIATDTAALVATFVLDQMQNTATCGQVGQPCNDGGQFMTAINGKAYVPNFQASRYFVVSTTAACSSSGVRVERSDDGGATFPTVIYDGPYQASVVDNGLTAGTNYCWRIVYKNGDGDVTAPSPSACVTSCPEALIVQSCGAGCAACPAGVQGPDGAACVLPNGTEGGFYQQAITATGGLGPAFAWTVTSGQLPTGFTLSGTGRTVTVSGTAAQAQAAPFVFTLQVADSQNPPNTDVRDFSVKIDPPTPNVAPTVNTQPPPPSGTVGVAYAYTFTAVNGQTPYTWRIAAGTLPPGLALNSSTGQLAGTPTAAAGAPFTFTVEAAGANGLTGQAVFTITIAPNTMTFTTGSLPGGTVGSAYNQSIAASGGIGPTFTWSVTAGALPPGLALGGTTRTATLSGTPTQAGTFNFTVQVADDGQPGVATAQAYSVTVAPSNSQPLSIVTASLPGAALAQAYQTQLTATGGLAPYTWSLQAGTLPPGLALDPASGTIAGTPTQAGTFSFTALVQDSNNPFQTASKTFALSVSVAPTITNASPLPQGVVGQGYFVQLNAANGTAPLTWTLSAGALPAGLTLSATSGAISGTPTAATPAPAPVFTVQVRDANGATGAKQFSITVQPAPAATCPPGPTVTTSSAPRGLVGAAYAFTVVAVGGQTAPLVACPPSGTPEAYCWSLSPLSANPLPAWLTLSANTGVASGTPPAASAGTTVTLRFRVTDAGGCTADSPDLAVAVDGPVAIPAVVLPDAGLNALYANPDGTPVTLQATGGDVSCGGYTWSITVGRLPSGLNLNASTGVIFGQAAGPVGVSPPFTVRATDCQGRTAQQAFMVNIVLAVPVPAAPAAAAGQKHSSGFCWAGNAEEGAAGRGGTALPAAALLAMGIFVTGVARAAARSRSMLPRRGVGAPR